MPGPKLSHEIDVVRAAMLDALRLGISPAWADVLLTIRALRGTLPKAEVAEALTASAARLARLGFSSGEDLALAEFLVWAHAQLEDDSTSRASPINEDGSEPE